MEQKKWDQQIRELITELNIEVQGFQQPPITKDQEKRLKKRFKKSTIEEKDSAQTAFEKSKKLIEQVSKNYQALAKQNLKVLQISATTSSSRIDKEKAANQLKMADNLNKGFEKKYKDILESAKAIEKQEQQKRKTLIEQLQNRIKTVQDEYEEAGKIKIQKYRQNQTLKHQISKLQPQSTTTQSLYEAQMKKKQIQVEIQMTSLKQKIQMMNNFKNVSTETKQKIQIAEVQKQKIQAKLGIINGKEQQHKIVLTKAHLLLQQYKNAIKKINVELGKKERQAVEARQNVRKAQSGLVDMEQKIKNLDKEEETQKNQIQMLLTLEQNLQKQIA